MLADVRILLIEELAADVVVVAARGAELQQATDAAQVENLPEDLGVGDDDVVDDDDDDDDDEESHCLPSKFKQDLR